MKTKRSGDRLVAYLSGEIDHSSAEKLRNEIENLLTDQTVKRLTMDFSHVSFMDSSGVGMVIGRYKTMMMRNGMIYARNMQPSVRRLFYMAGLHRIIAQEELESGDEDE